ncbi:MAG: hypothetical protein NTX82_02285 [Candidatus Parcubacteria bacterium]|nr:hypothetical protein [Candidatus Parcubacteria bacterium]
MPSGLIEVDNTHWRCNNCGETGDTELNVPDQCPNCQSKDIWAPLIKKGGPDDHLGLEKKY